MLIKIYTYTKLLIISLFLALFQQCSIFQDEGECTTMLREVNSFTEIQLNAVADVFYHYSDSSFIEITYYRKQLKNIKITNKDKVLTIDNQCNKSIRQGYKIPQINIYTPLFSQIVINEAGSFTCIDTLKMPFFIFRVVGSLVEADLLIRSKTFITSIESVAGVVNIEGQTPNLELYNRGETKINAIDVNTQNVKVTQQSFQDVWIRTNGMLKYSILRSGNIHLIGEPISEGEILGFGKLIRHEESSF